MTAYLPSSAPALESQAAPAGEFRNYQNTAADAMKRIAEVIQVVSGLLLEDA